MSLLGRNTPEKEKKEVKPSARALELRKLETPEQIQEHIQKLFSESSTAMKKGEGHPLYSIMQKQRENLKHIVEETRNISRMRMEDLQKFWHKAYGYNEALKELVNEVQQTKK